MKLEDHPAIKDSWSALSWAQSGGSSSQIHSLDSVLDNGQIIKLPHDSHVQLTRRQDKAIAALFCEKPSLLPNLCSSLSKCVGQTIREIGLREVNDDLTLK
jgi:hypothetical protein